MDHAARVDALKKSGLFSLPRNGLQFLSLLRAHPSLYMLNVYTGVHFILTLNTALVMVLLSLRKPAISESFPPAPHLTFFHRRVSKLSKFLENSGFPYDTALVIRDKAKRKHIYPGFYYQKYTSYCVQQ